MLAVQAVSLVQQVIEGQLKQSGDFVCRPVVA
jgi:hypothetical protein